MTEKNGDLGFAVHGLGYSKLERCVVHCVYVYIYHMYIYIYIHDYICMYINIVPELIIQQTGGLNTARRLE